MSAPEDKSTGHQNVSSWCKLLWSPSIVLLAGAVFFVMGLITAQVFNHDSNGSTPLSSHGQAEASSNHSVARPEKDAAPSEAIQPAATLSIPESMARAEKLPTTDDQSQNTADQEASANPTPTPFIEHGSSVEPSQYTLVAYQPVTPPRVGAGVATQETSSDSSIDVNDKQGALLSGQGKRPPDRMVFDDITPKPNEEVHSSTTDSPDALHRWKAEQAEQHMAVTNLANQVLSAIQFGNQHRTEALLGQLTQIKGEENLFVQKLEAYAHIQQGNLEEARGVLAAILAARPDDFEAGLNMAVVEIQSGQHDNARGRLERLLDLYPEQAQIGNYLRQLNH